MLKSEAKVIALLDFLLEDFKKIGHQIRSPQSTAIPNQPTPNLEIPTHPTSNLEIPTHPKIGISDTEDWEEFVPLYQKVTV